MKGPAVIGLVLLAAGALLWLYTPSHVVWGNHHYLRHAVSSALIGVGAVFLLTGARR